MHINTIQYTEDGSVLLSSRETSTVTMFDNNYGNSPTRPGFDWSQIDGINTGLHGNVLEVQQVPDGRNHARGLGSQGPVRHLHAKSKLIQQWRIAMQSGNIYRVYQYDFKGFFFASKA